MENQPLESKNIKISSVEDVGWGIKLKGEDGAVYNVSKFKKEKVDGLDVKTVAWKTLEMLAGYGMGLTKNIKFATVPNNHDGTSRYVRMIGEPELVSSVNIGIEQGSRPNQANNAPQGNSTASGIPYSQPPSFLKQENTYNQDKPKDEVQNHIRWCNSLNNACLLIAHQDGNVPLLENIESLANQIYKLEPKTEPTGEEDFNQPSIEEKINVEDIPFV